MRRHRMILGGAVSVSVGAGLLASGVPIVQKIIVDDVIIQGERQLVPWLGVLLAIGLGSFAATAARRYLGTRFSLNVQHDLRSAIYRHLHELDERARSGYQPGDLFSRATADITLLQGVLGRIHLLIGHVVHLLAALVAMVFLSVPLALMVAACVPGFLVVARRMRTRVFPSAWYDQRALADTTAVVAETVGGVRVIKAFGSAERESGRYASTARELFRSRLRSQRMAAFYGATLEALPALAQVLVVGVGGWLAIDGVVTIGTFVAFASFVSQMLRPVRSISVFLTNGQQARAGAERIAAFLGERASVLDPSSDQSPAPTRGAVDFVDVSFAYEPGQPVLSGCSLSVAGGERVAIVGPSGSGKSTLAKLLVRLYDPDEGSVRVDGTDVRRVPLGVLRRKVGGTIDEPFLFSSSIRDNIAFGRESATEREVALAAEVAGLTELVADLPEGYDTVVGERGLTLSGGQRQRLALARAVMADPLVLVLDDATSAIDSLTEERVHDRLTEVGRGRTTIVIAHRRSTLRLVDRIVVMDGGRVVAEGTPQTLLAESAIFRSIWGGEEHSEPSVVLSAGESDYSRLVAEPPSPSMRRGRSQSGYVQEAVATLHLLEAVEGLPPLIGEPDDDIGGAEYSGRFGMSSVVRPFVKPLAVGLVLVATSAVLALAGPMLVRQSIDSGIVAGDRSMLVASAAVLFLVVVAGWGVAWKTTAHTARTAERMLYVLRVRLFRHLMRLPMRFFDRETTGRIIARMTADVEALAVLFQQGLVGTAVSFVTALGVLVVLLVLDWRLALSVLTVFVPLAVITALFRARARRAHSAVRETLSRFYSELGEGIEGIATTQLHVREDSMVDRLVDRSWAYCEARLRSVRLASAYFPAVQFLAAVASAIVLGVGAVRIEAGAMSTGLLMAFLLYVDHLFRPMQELSEQLDQWTAARVSLDKIADLLDEDVESGGVGRTLASEGSRSVDMDAVTFSYPGFESKALDEVTLRVEPGETVAIVGESGAGKSSLAKLVMSFYSPTTGDVAVDGVSLSELDPIAHRRGIGYVPQEPVLFGISLRDNIAYGRPDATDPEVERVARMVGIHGAIDRLPEGYDTIAGLQGRTLSMGERQLICLARALLLEPGLLILDEATANLDMRSEAWVQAAMKAAAMDRTTVVIAHRLQTVSGADRIVVLDRGRIVEDGRHEELVSAGGTYAALWRAFADAETG